MFRVMKDALAVLAPVDHGFYVFCTAIFCTGLAVIEDHVAHMVENLKAARPIRMIAGPAA
jgi:hypothetical protein